MNYYCSTIPPTLAEKLKEKGMPIRYEQTDEGVRPMTMCCEVLDWLIEKGWIFTIDLNWNFTDEEVTNKWEWGISKVGLISSQPEYGTGLYSTWHEAANAAIEKALTLI